MCKTKIKETLKTFPAHHMLYFRIYVNAEHFYVTYRFLPLKIPTLIFFKHLLKTVYFFVMCFYFNISRFILSYENIYLIYKGQIYKQYLTIVFKLLEKS